MTRNRNGVINDGNTTTPHEEVIIEENVPNDVIIDENIESEQQEWKQSLTASREKTALIIIEAVFPIPVEMIKS